jgi:hypothetical protein
VLLYITASGHCARYLAAKDTAPAFAHCYNAWLPARELFRNAHMPQHCHSIAPRLNITSSARGTLRASAHRLHPAWTAARCCVAALRWQHRVVSAKISSNRAGRGWLGSGGILKWRSSRDGALGIGSSLSGIFSNLPRALTSSRNAYVPRTVS